MDALNCIKRECPALKKGEGTEKKNEFFLVKVFFRIVFTFSFFLVSYLGNATNYYVSNSGSDGNSGTSESLAWKTLTKVNSFSFKPGDQILFERGNVWTGTIVVKSSGTSGSPILYGAYGAGANPVISGFTTVTGWVNEGSGIYSKALTVDSAPEIVTINNVQYAKGRTPNSNRYNPKVSDYYHIDAIQDDNIIVDSECDAAVTNWKGAEIVIRSSNYWDWTIETIESHSGTTLKFRSSGDPNAVGFGYFIQNDVRTLDQLGEWYYGAGKFYMYFGTANPNNYTVKVSTVDKVIDVNTKDYVTVKNIKIEGGNLHGISTTEDYLTVDNCYFDFNYTAIYAYTAHDLTVTNCNITHSLDRGIYDHWNSDGAYIANNTIDSTGLVIGAFNGDIAACSMMGITVDYAHQVYSDKKVIIEYNKVLNSGSNGINIGGDNAIARYNYINGFCMSRADGGGIHRTGTNDFFNMVYDRNIIFNGIVSDDRLGLPAGKTNSRQFGIYLDVYSYYVTISNNTISNVAGGIHLLGAQNVNIIDNTVYSCRTGVILHQRDAGTDPIRGVKMNGNVVVNYDPNYNILSARSETDDLVQFGDIDKNYYNSNTVNETPIATMVNTWRATYMSLPEWQTNTSFDVNSCKSPQCITGSNDLKFLYNTTKSSKTVSLSEPMIDAKGTKYSSIITLQPYTSLVLIKDQNPQQSDLIKPIISEFTIPTTSSTFVVPINKFTASDNNTVTGFKLTESSTIPKATDADWLSSAPTSYTFSSEGTKTLYAWVKDDAGNISSSISAQIVISLYSSQIMGNAEVYGTLSTSSKLRAIPITFSESGEIKSITIYHEGGTGNMLMGVYSDEDGTVFSLLGVTASTAVYSMSGWQTVLLTSPVSVVAGQTIWIAWVFENSIGIRFTSGAPARAVSTLSWTGAMPLYFGNASYNDFKYSIYCNYIPNNESPDETIPLITNFSIPESSSSLIVPINSLTATDNTDVTGYKFTETNNVPTAEESGWMTTAPESYTFSSAGSKTLYAWAKDAAGNISNPASSNVIISLPAIYNTEDINICEGDSYEGMTETGQHKRILTATSGADSIVTTNLTVNPIYHISENITILEGESYQGWTESGEYERSLTSIAGCDSIVTTNLAVALNKNITEYITICEGSSYEGWTISGKYVRMLKNSSGADSIITTNLTVNPVYHIFEDVTIFEGGNYLGWTDSGQYERTLISSSGCDSIVTTNLMVTLNDFVTEDINICNGSSYEGWTKTGQYQRVLMASSGADSVVITNLTVNPIYNLTEDITILDGETYLGWTESGTYKRALTSLTGCDSIVTTNLRVMDHFKPVLWNENGQNYMNFYISDALIDGIELEINDEIGIYDGNLCVGVGKLSGTINKNDNSTYLFVKASQDDGSKNGFTSGNQISYRIWDYDKQTELIVNRAFYKNDVSAWISTGRFIESGTSVVEIAYTHYEQTRTQSITLERGWNIFSSDVMPELLAMDAVQEEICSMGYLFEVQDEVGNTLERTNAKAGWVNNIGDLKSTEGYKIRVKSDCVLQITGQPVALPLNVTLRKGANLISFPYNGSVDAMRVIKPLIEAGILEKVQDEKGNSIEYWSSIGWVNGIGNFNSGEGYLVQVSDNGVLPIVDVYEKSGSIQMNELETEHFMVAYEGNGSNHMNINVENLAKIGLNAGDEIAIYDGDICVGAIKLSSTNIVDDVVSLHASASDEDVVNGFTEGNQIIIKVWHRSKSAGYQASSEVIEGDMIFQKHGSVFIQFAELGTTGINNNEIVDFNVYPNPTKNYVNVHFSALPEKETKIELTDISGRLITSKNVESSLEVFDIQSQPAGVYFIKILSGESLKVNKLIIN